MRVRPDTANKHLGIKTALILRQAQHEGLILSLSKDEARVAGIAEMRRTDQRVYVA